MKALLLITILVTCSFSQTGIFIKSTCNGPTGERLIYQVKQDIDRSNLFNLVEDSSYAKIQLILSTLDPKDHGTAQDDPLNMTKALKPYTVYSVVWAVRIPLNQVGDPRFYWDTYVGICGSERVLNVAEDIVDKTEEISRTYIELVREVVKERG